jgi:hypothetical protein
MFIFCVLSNVRFHYNTLLLYQAVCAQSNNYVSHEICKQIDDKQLMYCIMNPCKFDW